MEDSQYVVQFYASTEACTFHGDCEIPNMCNKTHVDILIADIYNDIYIKAKIGTLFASTGLSNYYTKAEIDTLFSSIDLSIYYTKPEADDIDNELSTLILNTYTKTEVDTLLYTNYFSLSFIVDNFYSKTEIDSTLSAYTNSTQLHNGFYSKVKTNLIFDTYTTTTQLYNDCFYSKGYVNQMLIQSTTSFEFYYTKGDIDILLADKVSNSGNVSLPSHLDIGTTYTSSRIRCNAEVGGHTYWFC